MFPVSLAFTIPSSKACPRPLEAEGPGCRAGDDGGKERVGNEQGREKDQRGRGSGVGLMVRRAK